jgi:cellulose synthase/poly-beta-1,6-N-acetylglucosamine synthase-like glycosyltransferase
VRADTVATLVSTLIHPDSKHLSACQGAVLIERGGYWWLRHIASGMEWSSWCFFAPGFARLAGSAHFGGGNAAWRKKALRQLGFDPGMLTEDIDITVRALANGHFIEFVPWAQVGELCPVGLRAFYKQRLRWAMGWEQVTFKRMGAIFESSKLTETRKWQTAMILLMRYFSVGTSLVATSSMIVHTVYNWITHHQIMDAAPLRVLATFNMIIVVFTIVGQGITMVRQREPWHRALEVLAFIPVSPFYLTFQFVLIFVSWVQLSCCTLEWVPTARSANSEQHSIAMPGASSDSPAAKRPGKLPEPRL